MVSRINQYRAILSLPYLTLLLLKAIYKKAAALKDPVLEVGTKKDLIENLSSNGKVQIYKEHILIINRLI